MASKESRPEIDKPDTVEMKKKDLRKMRIALIGTSILLVAAIFAAPWLAGSDSLSRTCMVVSLFLLFRNCIHVATLGVKE